MRHFGALGQQRLELGEQLVGCDDVADLRGGRLMMAENGSLCEKVPCYDGDGNDE